MKLRLLAGITALLFLLSGCDLLSGFISTDNINATDVRSVHVTNVQNGTEFTVQDANSVRALIKQINALKLDTPGSDASAAYTLKILYAEEAESARPLSFSVADENTVITPDGTFITDAQELLSQIEKLECDTFTDKELIHSIFSDDYWDHVSIRNEKGDISVDKILDLPDQCPALFELLSRSTALKSMADSGLELLREYANSANEALRERAAKLGEILSNLIPSLRNQIEDILQNSAK